MSNVSGSKWAHLFSSLDDRTVAKAIGAVLASEGIILKKLSARFRVCVHADEVQRLLACMISVGKGTTFADWIRPAILRQEHARNLSPNVFKNARLYIRMVL